MPKSNLTKKLRVLSLLSGKGGVGKTLLALSLAKFLGYLHKKCIVIDFDLSTHGASYFFQDEIEELQEKLMESRVEESKLFSILDNAVVDSSYSVDAVTDIEPISLDLFDFLPARIDFSKKIGQVAQVKYALIQALLDKVIEILSPIYDFIIIDCQAGPELTSEMAAKVSNSCIVISEVDSISVAAVKNLDYQLRDSLPKRRTWLLLNKLFKEEMVSYSEILPFTIFPTIGALPFDRHIKSVFAFGIIPLDKSKPSSYLLGLLQIGKILFRDFEEEVGKFEEGIKKQRLGELEKAIEDMKRRREELSNQIVSHEQRYRYGALSNILRFAAVISTIIATAGIVASFVLYQGFEVTRGVGVLLPAITGLVVALSITISTVYSIQTRKKREAERITIEELRNEHAELQESLDKFETLLATRETKNLLTTSPGVKGKKGPERTK